MIIYKVKYNGNPKVACGWQSLGGTLNRSASGRTKKLALSLVRNEKKDTLAAALRFHSVVSDGATESGWEGISHHVAGYPPIGRGWAASDRRMLKTPFNVLKLKGPGKTK